MKLSVNFQSFFLTMFMILLTITSVQCQTENDDQTKLIQHYEDTINVRLGIIRIFDISPTINFN